MGKKNLFLLDRSGSQNETLATCVLDFYVHESRQRSGCGRRLFEHMLQDQDIEKPAYMAIDRPSPKLLAFLKKYYGLAAPIPQVRTWPLGNIMYCNLFFAPLCAYTLAKLTISFLT